MAVSTGTKTLENLKLKNYRFNTNKTCVVYVPYNTFHLLKTDVGLNRRPAERTSKKLLKSDKNLSNSWL